MLVARFIRRQLKRRSVLAFFQKLPPCLVGIEACTSSHHWSRGTMASGHVNRTYRPNTWLHRPMLQNVKKALPNSEPSTHGAKRTIAKTPMSEKCQDRSCGLGTPPHRDPLMGAS
jgi:transposase